MLGLDPVKLEHCYLVLYRLYAAHMGQGKEVAQVATKHAISDLQKEAVAQEAMPSVSLVSRNITVHTVDHDVATLQSLVRHLSRVARKSLLA